jgi:hypothetical protein
LDNDENKDDMAPELKPPTPLTPINNKVKRKRNSSGRMFKEEEQQADADLIALLQSSEV